MLFRITGKRSEKRTDEELLAEFISTGDIGILGTLYSDYMHLVYGVCLKYLKDRDESKDAVMQIFEKMVAELPGQKSTELQKLAVCGYQKLLSHAAEI